MEALMLLPFLFMLFMFGFLFASQGFWIWMIVDCAKNQGLKDNDKLVWILVVVLCNWIGALIYFFVARTKRAKPPRPDPRGPQSRRPPPPLQKHTGDGPQAALSGLP